MKLEKITDNVQEVSPLVAFLTNATCGEACWQAREMLCRCCCGGKNHGCLKTPNGIAPTRMAKINSVMYQLKSIGKYNELYHQAKAINDDSWKQHEAKFGKKYGYYAYKETEAGAPARLKPVTDDQCNRWIELSAYKGLTSNERFQKNDCNQVYLLWTKIA